MADDELYPSPDDYQMKESKTYTPPKVWQWDQEGEDNRFSKINRPMAGATMKKRCPKVSTPCSFIHSPHLMASK